MVKYKGGTLINLSLLKQEGSLAIIPVKTSQKKIKRSFGTDCDPYKPCNEDTKRIVRI